MAQDCPWYNERARKYEPRCGARFTDLEHAFPPANHPDEPIYRQWQPGREDLPNRRRLPDVPTTGPSLPPTLSGWPSDVIGYRCSRCDRREMFDKAGMLAAYGDVPTNGLLAIMAKGCPRWGKTDLYELCGCMFILPWTQDGTLGE